MKGEGNYIFQKKTFLPIFVPSKKDRPPSSWQDDRFLPSHTILKIVENMEVWDFSGLTRNSGAGKFFKEREYC